MQARCRGAVCAGLPPSAAPAGASLGRRPDVAAVSEDDCRVVVSVADDAADALVDGLHAQVLVVLAPGGWPPARFASGVQDAWSSWSAE
jgi:hypothetical protein